MPELTYISPARDRMERMTPAIAQLCFPGWTEIDPLDSQAAGDLVAELLAVE
jgi:hypothetical protein